MIRFLQNYPHFLEVSYDRLYAVLRPFRRWLRPGGRWEPFFIRTERATKGALFDCRMCGQCILHSTGMTCSMTCPKTLRNGPCGGVRTNGHCEVKPEMRCVWVDAFERSGRMPVYGREIRVIQPPLDRRLEGTASWLNMLHEVDKAVPRGWKTDESDAI